jgi:hypothetical protein
MMNPDDPFNLGQHVDQSYRDSIGTIGPDGKRKWVFPWQPKGKMYNRRTMLSVIYLCLFFGLPFSSKIFYPAS